ncbi:hypothetical protein F2Q69_00043308 [Brassica cretica]|uniref:Uncharacterized protein n=1 Tax=Brassica cretica TaxID=69181 RepID=A0A8S9NRX7_BRACR|nr:hypothetical protein F2Q69_00043308 [Brassica cretica]
MFGNTKDKIAVRNNAGKTTPAATAPMANAYANATVLEKIENLAVISLSKHKGKRKILSNPISLARYRIKKSFNA